MTRARLSPTGVIAAVVATSRVSGRNRAIFLVVALLSIGAIAVANEVTGMDVSLSAFYLLPVAAVAVAVSSGAGYGFAAVAALAWTFDGHLGAAATRSISTQLANSALRFATIALVVAVIGVLRSALEDARNSERRSKEFLAYAAHQLRTPVAGVRASAEALVLTADQGTRDQLLSNITSESARMGRLIGSLLRITRLDQGDPLEWSATDLTTHLNVEVERARALAPHLEVTLVLGPGIPRSLVLDPVAVAEMLANLLDNARRHAAGRVVVRAALDGDVLAVTVTDDGPGLPVGVEHQAFERFVSLDGHGGTGLGLTIARSLAEAHGGGLVYEDRSFELRVSTQAAPPDVERPRLPRPAR